MLNGERVCSCACALGSLHARSTLRGKHNGQACRGRPLVEGRRQPLACPPPRPAHAHTQAQARSRPHALTTCRALRDLAMVAPRPHGRARMAGFSAFWCIHSLYKLPIETRGGLQNGCNLGNRSCPTPFTLLLLLGRQEPHPQRCHSHAACWHNTVAAATEEAGTSCSCQFAFRQIEKRGGTARHPAAWHLACLSVCQLHATRVYGIFILHVGFSLRAPARSGVEARPRAVAQAECAAVRE